jgi:hypothetical protein
MSNQEPPKDRRTKAYKKWKAKYDAAPEGLGDVIESITEATGIKAVVEAVADAFDADCGCDERKTKINSMLRFKPKECLTEQEFDTLSFYYSEAKGGFNESIRITPQIQSELLGIYNRIMPRTRDLTNCGSCFLKDIYRPLSNVYSTYL